jgi:hypothetical protein
MLANFDRIRATLGEPESVTLIAKITNVTIP